MDRQEEPRANGFWAAITELVADTAACVRFFSRLPLPALCRADDPARLPDFAKISRAIPLAGWIVALPAVLLGLVLGFTALPPLVTGFLVAGALAAVTGALHEDGLSDLVDGFFGGHTPVRRLEIMKDSRIGAFGAIALVISTGVRASLIAALLDRFSPLEAMTLLLGAESFSRMLIVWQWTILPSARPDGLGNKFGQPGRSAGPQACVIGAICLLPVVPTLYTTSLSITALSLALLLATASAYGIGILAKIKIGGFTGDVLGAVQQVSSLAFLIGCLSIP
ncbi:adenosylcobinamide-GDP ribazoletransferase [Roseibium algae]|uniref:Adenosylcobinamide-GDP ribazoletransferase n=1 Tax=Roseibium algae TaxID=3123038 RepID=A0ABU8TIW4_9HYPH